MFKKNLFLFSFLSTMTPSLFVVYCFENNQSNHSNKLEEEEEDLQVIKEISKNINNFKKSWF